VEARKKFIVARGDDLSSRIRKRDKRPQLLSEYLNLTIPLQSGATHTSRHNNAR
jgi:hypothetical protein